MTPQKAANAAANNLIQAFKALRLKDEVVNFDILQPHAYRRAPSDRQFFLDGTCMEAIEKSTRKLKRVIGNYPREKAHEAICDIVIAVRDRDIPVEAAHAELIQDILNWLRGSFNTLSAIVAEARNR